jgi:hypothetical protein
MNFINRNNDPTQVSTDIAIERLKEKHPPRHPIESLNDDIKSVMSYVSPVSITSVSDINGDIIRKIILKRPKLKRPGVDKLRYDHLRTLVGYGGILEPAQEIFAKNLSELCILLLDAKVVPLPVFDFIRDTELLAIPKGEEDIRPLGLGSIMRKLCSILFLRSTNDFNSKHFKDLQYGVDKEGCAKIIHSGRVYRELYPNRDFFCMDGKNAYNSCSRTRGLCEVKKLFPLIVPFLRNIYGTSSNGWYWSKDFENVTPIDCMEGWHQGDVLGTWLYSITINPFLQGPVISSVTKAS